MATLNNNHHPLMETSPLKAVSSPSESSTSPSKKNKRKSHEPKKLQIEQEKQNEGQNGVKRPRLGSTGSTSDDRASTSTPPKSSCSPTHSSSQESRTPSPNFNNNNAKQQQFNLAPKMRFKQSQNQAPSSDKKDKSPTSKSHFRPWDVETTTTKMPSSSCSESGSSSTPSPAPASALPPPPSASALPPSPSVLPPLAAGLAAGVPPSLLPFLPPSLFQLPTSVPTAPMMTPDLMSRLAGLYQQQPLLSALTARAGLPLLPQFTPSAIQQPLTSQQPSPVARSPSPINVVSSSPEPEQNEPLALVKHSREELVSRASPKKKAGKAAPPSAALNVSFSSSSSESEIASPIKENAKTGEKPKQRNYKNMTRERRVEANARERQRVHTITAAFDRLQSLIPTDEEDKADAKNGKNNLSKLSIIKIATSYITVLSRMAGHDYTADQSAPSVESCVEKCRALISAESGNRKKGSSLGKNDSP